MSKLDEKCPPTPRPSSPKPTEPATLKMDLPCTEDTGSNLGMYTPRPKAAGADFGSGDVGCQTRRDTGSDAPRAYSCKEPGTSSTEQRDTLKECEIKPPLALAPRNPITGMGLGEDGVGGLKQWKPKDRRDGNPVTGEGYKSGEVNHQPSMNGANQVINKNRIPPGGYSSGLW